MLLFFSSSDSFAQIKSKNKNISLLKKIQENAFIVIKTSESRKLTWACVCVHTEVYICI